MINNISKQKFLEKISSIKYGSINIETSEGDKYYFKGEFPGEEANLKINNWSFVRKLAYTGDIGFAESYRDNKVETPNLLTLLTFALRNIQAFDSYVNSNLFGRALHKIIYLLNTNTISQSRKNIHKHYDLGNDFYMKWLDKSMTYSSGIFNSKEDNLFDAQKNKYNRIIENLNPSGRLLEIGCGWGGFIKQALSKKDFEIKGITLSSEQLHYAKNILGKNANIALEDYRIQQGKFDNIVSIEMFEAVGSKYWPVYFRKVKELLAENGKAVIQTITINEDLSEEYQKGADMIRSFIFPGGMLPSEFQFKYHANKNGLKIIDIYRFGHDYAKTLDLWANNFNLNINEIRRLKFDTKFIKLWNFYLASCSSCFSLNRTDVIQVTLEHA